jgi:catechol 2,3-dioxygenase-like lactoylglutathione lyase family enzyme
MIGYITIGAVDIERAKIFYDSVLGTIGWQQFADYGDPVGYAQNETGEGQTIWICKPFDGETARAGNGIMVGFDAETKDQVHAFYDAAMKAARDRRLPARPHRQQARDRVQETGVDVNDARQQASP